jgi:signal transduction histidine kinase
MLDETKIHQVVMNFLDNAIYYTPAGGKIRVSLHETSTAIECRIRDNGIGVPRAAQHRLFSKFYRADNAQRARPDGTGLGLFMAKKVIVAQGGAIIFESEEGKGSTFGFRFAKVQPTTTEGK